MILKTFYLNKKKLYLYNNKCIKVNFINQRTMFSSSRQGMTHIIARKPIVISTITKTTNSEQNIGVLIAYKYKKTAVKQYSNDGTGQRSHVCINNCVSNACEEKKCVTLCDKLKNSEILGHTTHGPVVGRYYRYISNFDANGKKKTQYFIPVEKEKNVTATEMQKLVQQNEIKEDLVQTKYLNSSADIYDKFKE